MFNALNAELNPICHLLALLGGATIVVVSRLRVNKMVNFLVERISIVLTSLFGTCIITFYRKNYAFAGIFDFINFIRPLLILKCF